MSVGLELQSVRETVITTMAHTHVPVILVTDLMMMVSTVMVRNKPVM